MDFFSKLKDFLGFKNKEKVQTEKPTTPKEVDTQTESTSIIPAEVLPPEDVKLPEGTNADKVLEDFELMHPAACIRFKQEFALIKERKNDVEYLRKCCDNCKENISLYNDCLNYCAKIRLNSSQIISKFRPEIIFEVQGTVQENIDLNKDLIPYVIQLFLYDCKRLVFRIFEFFHRKAEDEEFASRRQSIADGFVNKIANAIKQRIEDILNKKFKSDQAVQENESINSSKELLELAQIAKEISKKCSSPNLDYTVKDILDEKFQDELSKQISQVISRYENRHMVDKIKDYLQIIWYVLRFFYSIFFGAGFLYIIWLGKNIENIGQTVDEIFRGAVKILDQSGESPSAFIVPMFASVLSKITIVLTILAVLAVIVYFVYRVFSVRNKLRDIVTLNISMYAASLLEINVLQSTEKLVQEIKKAVYKQLKAQQSKYLLATRDKGNSDEGPRENEIAAYIGQVKELLILYERLIACAKQNS
ncbi:MAG: hypothetical protein Q4D21_03030 [Phascolarctobacterium sp.]|nr:hypothetical protein [Phascolarctobacterium sp.]